MSKRKAIAFGVALLLGGFVQMTNPETAAAVPVTAKGASVLAGISDGETTIERVKHRRYRRRFHGPRFRHRRRGRRHHYRGWYYAYPWWLHVDPAPRYGDSHVDWCLRRFRSYNPRTNQYRGYDGRYHRCRSPYSY